MELDVDKAPRVGENVTVTCAINSLHDVADYKAQILPVDKLLVCDRIS
jgi:hypothetical protein